MATVVQLARLKDVHISKVYFTTFNFQRRRNKNKGPQPQQRPPEESCPEQVDSRERELAAAKPAAVEEDTPQDPAPQKEPEPESLKEELPQKKAEVGKIMILDHFIGDL